MPCVSLAELELHFPEFPALHPSDSGLRTGHFWEMWLVDVMLRRQWGLTLLLPPHIVTYLHSHPVGLSYLPHKVLALSEHLFPS